MSRHQCSTTCAKMPTPHDPLACALNEFKEQLTAKEKNELVCSPKPTELSVLELTRQIDETESRRGFRKMSWRFSNFIQCIHQFTSVVDTFVSSKPETAALVWGSVKFAIVAISNFTEYFEKMSDMFQKLGQLCPVFDQFQKLLVGHQGLQDAILGYYALVVDFCTKALRFIRSHSVKQLLKSMWKSFKQHFQDLENSLYDQKEQIDYHIKIASESEAHKERQLASLYRRQGAEHRLLEIEQWAEAREWRVEHSKFAQKLRREALLTRLCNYDHNATFSKARQTRHARTGEWLFGGPEYTKWMDRNESSIIWCYGIPGAGKTVLATAVVDAIFEKHWAANVSISYFFCDFGNKNALEMETILGSWARQMLTSYGDIPPATEQKIQNILDGHLQSLSMDDLFSILVLAAELFKRNYLVLDGLDECADHVQLETASYLQRLLAAKTTVKVYLSSRPELKSLHVFKDVQKLSLGAISDRPEIEAYITEELMKRRNNRTLVVEREATMDKIRERFMEGANGMFLWVTLQMHDISRENNDEGILRRLENLPRDLPETYERILDRIVEDRLPEVAVKIFKWLMAARQPPTLGELNEATAFEAGQKSWSRNKLQNDELKMLSNCENLVILSDIDGCVQFAHTTVPEFLSSMTTRHLQNFLIPKADSSLHCAKLCLTYLHFADFETQVTTIPKLKPRDSFLDMPAQSWVPVLMRSHGHLKVFWNILSMFNRKPKQGPKQKVKDLFITKRSVVTLTPTERLAQKFKLLTYTIEHWLHHCSTLSDESTVEWDRFRQLVLEKELPFRHLPSEWTPDSESLHLDIFEWAIQNNNPALVLLLRTQLRIIGRNLVEYTESALQSLYPLEISAAKGYVKVVQLLQHEETRSAVHGRALQAAAKGGYVEIVDLLIGTEVGDFPTDLDKSMALQCAAAGGYIGIVETLLAADADANAPAAEHGGRTALQAAAEGGHIAIVERLLVTDADVDAPAARDEGRTALQAAAGGGHVDIVHMLLEAGAEVNAEPAEYGGKTALQAAACGEHVDIVQRLLESKADINAPAAHHGGRTALQAASAGGHIDIFHSLLEAKADVNAPAAEYDGKTALQAAAGSGQNDIVRRLLQENADVNAPAAYNGGRTALQAAAGSGHVHIVHRLLDANADVNAPAARIEGRTALQAGAEGGHTAIAQCLLLAMADASAPAAYHGGVTALQAAAGCGHIDIVNKLLEAKAAINAPATYHGGRTALQAAAGGGYVDIVRRLLQAKADVNAPAAKINGRTALQAAAGNGHVDVVHLLLEAKADINAPAGEREGRTALQAAAEGAHIDIEKILKRALA